MKYASLIFSMLVFISFSCNKESQDVDSMKKKSLFLDIHTFGPGKVTAEDVAKAHQKDLATESKYGVSFIQYWVDEATGKVYCLSEATDAESIYKTHQEAHGLVPEQILPVASGQESMPKGNAPLFLDIHELGPGNVTAKAVAEAHVKDLATEGKYGVNFINYWVDEKSGTIFCLSEAKDAQAVINTHKEAHGLVPVEIHQVKQGQ